MGLVTPASGVIGGFSLLAVVQMICLTHLITCMVFVAMASSDHSVDYAGVRISGYMQCINAAWFLLGIPCIILGGVGAMFRVEAQLKAYIAYLVGTLIVVIMWLGIFITYGNACNTLQPSSGQYKKQALMVCSASNGMVIFWMLVLLGIVAGAIYIVWSMSQYVGECLRTELCRYQEPWQAVQQLADGAAENEAKSRQFTASKAYQYGTNALAPEGYSNDPLKVRHLSTQVPTPDWMQDQGGFDGRKSGGRGRSPRRGFC